MIKSERFRARHATRVPWLEWVKAFGTPLATVLVTVVGGAWVNQALKNREEFETNERLYTQLLVQREQSDANIRKDMFGVVIKQFLSDSSQQDWSEKVLQLELLASNFNQTLDLAPLFKDIARRLPTVNSLDLPERGALLDRMDRTAAALNFKQVNALARRGWKASKVIGVGGWPDVKTRTIVHSSIPRRTLVPSTVDRPVSPDEMLNFELELIDVSVERREIEVRLRVGAGSSPTQEVDRHFWVGRYDFPMLDNTHLPDGLRAAVVVTSFSVPEVVAERKRNSSAEVHLVVFPAASASFKERQDYDDIVTDMLRQQQPAAEGDTP